MALVVLRDAVVADYASARPERAAALWPDHPKVLVSQALTDIGIAAVKRQPPPPEALDMIEQASRLSPLSHDPFLVRGIRAQQDGNQRLAEKAFIAARRRAPREAAPRYFLSQLYVNAGRGPHGLDELAALARLLPNGLASVAPSLAAYARSSGDVAALKASFRNHPDLEQAVLLELAKNPADADLAFRLAHRVRGPGGAAQDWVQLLLPNLVQAGEYDRAYRLWQTVSGAQPNGMIFDSGFRGHPAPPPFNWTYRSDSAGFAETDGKGGLRVLFYGREDAVLASQTLMLAPGTYRMVMTVAGNPGGMLRWTLVCIPAKRTISILPLGAGQVMRPTMTFAVEAACPAQSLDLTGVAGDMPKAVDVTISALELTDAGDAR